MPGVLEASHSIFHACSLLISLPTVSMSDIALFFMQNGSRIIEIMENETNITICAGDTGGLAIQNLVVTLQFNSDGNGIYSNC